MCIIQKHPGKVRGTVAIAFMIGIAQVSAAQAAEDKSNIEASYQVAAATADVPESATGTAIVPATGATAAKAEPASADDLLVGDKLQVSFFEQLDLGQTVDPGMNGNVRTFYQRLDLTGEHLVDSEGAIAIPLIGRFVVAGLNAEEVEKQISEAYADVMGRPGDVHIALLDRQPVFVTGIVKAPGSFKYQPGMIALQAIALAGGYDRESKVSSRMIETERERERHSQAVERLERLMAKRVRLMQQRDLAQVSTNATEVTIGKDELTDPIASETSLLEAEISAHANNLSLLEAQIVKAKAERDALKVMSGLMEMQIDVRTERLRVLKQMQGRGLSQVESLWNAQKDVADFEMQRERLAMELSSVEKQIVEAEAARVKSASDYKVIAQRELVQVEDEIAQQITVADASGMIVSALESEMSTVLRGDATLAITVLRRVRSGTTTISADETTSLLPGDVVKIDVVDSELTSEVKRD